MNLDQLYEEFEQKLYRYAISLAHNSHQADDLVQETFLRAIRNFSSLEKLNYYQRQAWLYKVLRNVFLDAQRLYQLEHDLTEQANTQVRQIQLDSEPVWNLLSDELWDQIPQQDRELLQKRYVLGLNSQEIAHEMGIPPATVRSRLHLALKKLRAKKSRFL